MTSLRNHSRVTEKEIKKLQAKIQQLTEKCAECVDGQIHSDLVSIMKDSSKQVAEVYPVGSLANLFWKEQLKAATVKDLRQCDGTR